MKAKQMLVVAAVAMAMLSACTPSQKQQEPKVVDNPDMGVIDNGDSLVVTDVDVSSAAQIAADTAGAAGAATPQ